MALPPWSSSSGEQAIGDQPAQGELTRYHGAIRDVELPRLWVCEPTRYHGAVTGRSVRVLHISDLHMRSVDGPQAARARLEAASRWRVLGVKWTANIAEICRDSTPVDLVVFTGDLGDWGHPTDYPRALTFLKQTCAALDVSLDRLFVVPGNHDIDRSIQRTAWESLRRDIASDPHVYSRWMAGEDGGALLGDDRRDKILERQQAFWAVVTADLGRPELAPTHSPHRRLGYRQTVTLPELSQPIHVIGFDTAWLAGDGGDSGQLRLTEHQVSLLTTAESGEPLPGFRLALMHHRLADLADGSEARRSMADRVDLLLHGHQHEPATDVLQGPDHQLVILATGCLYEGDEGDHFPNACQVIDLELDEHARPRGAEVRFRGWSERGMFWGDDALLYESARSGRLRLHRGAGGWRFTEDSDVRQEHANTHAPGGEVSSRSHLSPERISCGHPDPTDSIRKLLSALSDNCTKARALQIEEQLYQILGADSELYLKHLNQYVAAAREAMAVVGGRMLHAGVMDPRIVAALRQLANDPDKWVRKKARDGLRLAGH